MGRGRRQEFAEEEIHRQALLLGFPILSLLFSGPSIPSGAESILVWHKNAPPEEERFSDWSLFAVVLQPHSEASLSHATGGR